MEEKCTQLSKALGAVPPTLFGVIKCRPPEWIPFIAIGSTAVLIIVVLVIRGCLRFSDVLWTHAYIVHKTRALLLYYALLGFINFATILNPRGQEIYDFIGAVSEGLLVAVFYNLLWNYNGGYEAVLPRVLGQQVSMNGRPLCCLRFKRKVTLQFVWVYEKFVLQFPFVQLLLVVIEMHSSNSGATGVGDNQIKMGIIVIRVLQCLSIFLSLYGIEIMLKLWKKEKKNPQIRKKIALFKLTVILNRLQGIIFTRVGFSVAPVGAMTGPQRAETWNSFLIVVEAVIFSFVATRLYTREDIISREDYKPSFHDNINTHRKLSEENDIEECNNDLLSRTNDQLEDENQEDVDEDGDIKLEMSYDATDVRLIEREEGS